MFCVYQCRMDQVKRRGEVFTPAHIAQYMVSYIPSDRTYDILEPACGDSMEVAYEIEINTYTGT